MKWVRMFYRNEDSHRIQQIQRRFINFFDEHYATAKVPLTHPQTPEQHGEVDGFGHDFYDNPGIDLNDVVDEVGDYLRDPVLPAPTNVIGHLQNQDTFRTTFPPCTPPRRLWTHAPTVPPR
jgi:hypothetical protein